MELKQIIETLNFSNLTMQILAPLIFCLADILTGFIQAVINKNVDSKIMRTGLLHKSLITIILFLSICFITFSFITYLCNKSLFNHFSVRTGCHAKIFLNKSVEIILILKMHSLAYVF